MLISYKIIFKYYMKSKRIKNKRQPNRSKKRINCKQKGGYTQEQNSLLNNIGLNNNQIQHLEDLGATYEQIANKINEIESRNDNVITGNSDDIADLIVEEVQNELMNLSTLSEDNADNDDIDEESMHLSELDVSPRYSGNTTDEEYSQFNGGRRYKKYSKKRRYLKTHRTNKRRKYINNKRRCTNKRKCNNKRHNHKGGKGMTDSEDTEPNAYKEDEYDQMKNAINY